LSTKKIAERIVENWLDDFDSDEWQLMEIISAALQEERERAAKIAEMDSILDWVGGSTGNAKGTANRIAAAIREGSNGS